MARPQPPARRYRQYLDAEREAALLYRRLAATVQGDRREALEELARMEETHAAHWEQRLRELGVEPPPASAHRPGLRTRLLGQAASALSLPAVLPMLERAERHDAGMYDGEPAALASMPDDERSHESVLRRLGHTGPGPGPIGHPEPWHRGDRSGAARAAVFGINDGLVSNTALIMGFAGSGVSSKTVLLAGLAGLLAGAFSMGAGEFVSVASQRDLFRREIDLEAAELREKPEEERKELELIYRAKGLDRDSAATVAGQIMSDDDAALDTLSREELGLDPGELGSPWKVAVSSFSAFAIGAFVVVVPFLLATGTAALVAAIIAAGVALVVVGGFVGALSGRGPVVPALRQLAVGSFAAACTYGIGALLGIQLA